MSTPHEVLLSFPNRRTKDIVDLESAVIEFLVHWYVNEGTTATTLLVYCHHQRNNARLVTSLGNRIMSRFGKRVGI